MKYLSWLGNSLYCSYPLPGRPERYPLKIRTTGSPTDRRRCEILGEAALASLRTKIAEGRFFEKLGGVAPKVYNPTYRRLCRRYICNRLRWQKSGRNEMYHLVHAYRYFGNRIARDITRDAVETWRQKMVKDGTAVNTVNNRVAYFRAVYAWANSESRIDRRLGYDPAIGMEKLKGGNVRQFVLTAEKFERNYIFLRDGQRARAGTRAKHATPWAVTPCPRFALFYLALWETGRRPKEVSQYTWEIIQELDIDGRKIHAVFVPPAIAKTDEPDIIPISDRLWNEIRQLGYRAGYIFRNSKGERWRYWSQHKDKLEKYFGQDGGWIRDTRRGFVTHKTEVQGHDPAHVRAISGHRTMAVFDRYRIGQLRNIVSVVQQAIPQDFRKIAETA